MSSCEKCWADSGGDTELYRRLLSTRECTFEEQAGPDAGWCPICTKKTLHQHTKICTLCGNPSTQGKVGRE